MRVWILALCLITGGSALAQPQDVTVPPNLDPGAVLKHDMQDWQMKQQFPWLYRPIQPEDYQLDSDKEPLIDTTGVDGQIVKPVPPPIPK